MPITIRQKKLIDNLLSGEFKTAKAAAIASGYSRKTAGATASRIMNESEFSFALEQAKRDQAREIELQTDKGRGPRSFADRIRASLQQVDTLADIIAKSVDEARAETNGNKMDLVTAATLSKIIHDQLVQLTKLRDALPGEGEDGSEDRQAWVRTVEYAYTEGAETCDRDGLEQALGRVSSIGTETERWILLGGLSNGQSGRIGTADATPPKQLQEPGSGGGE